MTIKADWIVYDIDLESIKAKGNVQISTINEITDGLHIKVNHQNHGMYFTDNRVIPCLDPLQAQDGI